MNSTAVIFILHGSPRVESSEPVQRLADVFAAAGEYGQVMLAFMECNSPTIADAVGICVRRGAAKIIAVPYLLHTGRHLVLDIPRILMEAAQDFPEVEILLTDPVGSAVGTSDALAGRAGRAWPGGSGWKS